MDTQVMKNMVIIKNLPSNMIEEAFVILKPNLKVKELNTMNIDKKDKCNIEQENNNYIIREAELLVSEYISKIERKDNIRKSNQMEKKYRRLKKGTIASFIFGIICLIINIVC